MLSPFGDVPWGERMAYFATRPAPLHAMLGSVGHSRETAAAYDWHGLKRGRKEFALFQYTVSGSGRLRVDNSEYEVTPGTAMLLHFPADNRYWLPASSEHWEFIYLCLYGREVMRLWPKLEAGHGVLVKMPPESVVVRKAAEIVTTVLGETIASPFAASALAYDWVMTMLAAAPLRETASPHAAALEKARRHGEENFARVLGVEELAQVAGFSRFHFTRLFTAHVGAPPMTWLAELRVREAARLLRETRLSLKEIAVRCGFSDPGYLGKVFLAKTGQPPGSFRRSGV